MSCTIIYFHMTFGKSSYKCLKKLYDPHLAMPLFAILIAKSDQLLLELRTCIKWSFITISSLTICDTICNTICDTIRNTICDTICDSVCIRWLHFQFNRSLLPKASERGNASSRADHNDGSRVVLREMEIRSSENKGLTQNSAINRDVYTDTVYYFHETFIQY